MTHLESLSNEIKAFQSDHSFNNELSKLSKKALDALIANGIPTRKNELWKYTNINHIFESELKFKQLTTETKNKMYKIDGFTNLIFVNGALSKESDATDFKINPLNNDSVEVINKNSNGLVDDFAANLNYSTMHDGHHFALEANKIIEKPIAIIHIHNSKEKTLRTNKNTFSIGSNSEVEILEIYISETEDQSVLNFASDIILEKNSKFTHVHHQSLNPDITFFNSIRTQVDKDAQYQNFNITVGGKLTRNNVHIDLNNEGANCYAHGTYTLLGKQHSDVNSFINHKAPHTESSQLYKGIMGEKSRGVFTGLIKVDKNAQLINSNQLNKNLILNKGAHANSRPQLEIFADDVKCSHGSTTGQLNEEELFYFESRGIRAGKARQMLSHAFTYDVLLKIENKIIRNYIQKDILNKFENKAFKE